MAARILVIEDNPTNLELLKFLLEAHGHTVLCATDGDEGLQLAHEAGPDLIICDLHLPRFDGFQVAKRLKSHSDTQSVPLVAVTAFAMPADRERALAAGYDNYFPKPITPETFIGELELCLPQSLRSHGTIQEEEKRYADPSHADEPVNERGRSPAEHRGTILVVDDSPTNRELVRLILEPARFQVLLAEGFSDAIDVATTHKVDLILTDMHMPPSTGLDLLQALSTHAGARHVPVVVFSSTSSGPVNSREVMAMGAAGYISRPIEPQDLVAEVERVLGSAARYPRQVEEGP